MLHLKESIENFKSNPHIKGGNLNWERLLYGNMLRLMLFFNMFRFYSLKEEFLEKEEKRERPLSKKNWLF